MTPDVAHGDPSFLRAVMDLFDQLLPALLRERREREPDHVAVVAGRDPDIALHDRALDRADRALVERLDLQQTRLGHRDARELVERDRCSVVLDRDPVEDGRSSPTGSDARQIVFEMRDRLFHLVGSVLGCGVDRHGLLSARACRSARP